MRTKVSLIVVGGLLLIGCSGCAWGPEQASNPDDASGASKVAAAECTPIIRRDGLVYIAYGVTDTRPKPFAEAEIAECDDNGPNARGSFFPGAARTEPVGTFEGFDSKDVLGLRFNKGMFSVFIAQSVPRARGEEILAALGSE